MPSNRTFETAYIGPFADIGSVNSATAYYPGQIGQRVVEGNKEYQFVQLDTGALTSATNGQLLYWKDPTNYIVTNNNLFANNTGGAAGAVNFVAGVATTTVTAGYFTFIQQKGPHSAILTDSITTAIGNTFVAGTTTSGKAAQTNAGTAPVSQPVGVATEISTAATHAAFLVINGIP